MQSPSILKNARQVRSFWKKQQQLMVPVSSRQATRRQMTCSQVCFEDLPLAIAVKLCDPVKPSTNYLWIACKDSAFIGRVATLTFLTKCQEESVVPPQKLLQQLSLYSDICCMPSVSPAHVPDIHMRVLQGFHWQWKSHHATAVAAC